VAARYFVAVHHVRKARSLVECGSSIVATKASRTAAIPERCLACFQKLDFMGPFDGEITLWRILNR
jgi:hypothetical protein